MLEGELAVEMASEFLSCGQGVLIRDDSLIHICVVEFFSWLSPGLTSKVRHHRVSCRLVQKSFHAAQPSEQMRVAIDLQNLHAFSTCVHEEQDEGSAQSACAEFKRQLWGLQSV